MRVGCWAPPVRGWGGAPWRGVRGEVVRERRQRHLVPEIVRMLAQQRDLRNARKMLGALIVGVAGACLQAHSLGG